MHFDKRHKTNNCSGYIDLNCATNNSYMLDSFKFSALIIKVVLR